MKDPVRFGTVVVVDLAIDKFETPAVDLRQQDVGLLRGDILNFFF
jgi:hypothetical protein